MQNTNTQRAIIIMMYIRKDVYSELLYHSAYKHIYYTKHIYICSWVCMLINLCIMFICIWTSGCLLHKTEYGNCWKDGKVQMWLQALWLSIRKLKNSSNLYMQRPKEGSLRKWTNGETNIGVEMWKRNDTTQCLLVFVCLACIRQESEDSWWGRRKLGKKKVSRPVLMKPCQRTI